MVRLTIVLLFEAVVVDVVGLAVAFVARFTLTDIRYEFITLEFLPYGYTPVRLVSSRFPVVVTTFC